MSRSSIQRSKSVIFEGLVTRFGYGVGGIRKKKKKKKMMMMMMRASWKREG